MTITSSQTGGFSSALLPLLPRSGFVLAGFVGIRKEGGEGGFDCERVAGRSGCNPLGDLGNGRTATTERALDCCP